MNDKHASTRFQPVTRPLRNLVSKKKKRYVDKQNNLDLDLTKITPRIIAMGFPCEKFADAIYRNPMSEVLRFLTLEYPGNQCKVYNLCSERAYENPKCFSNWAAYPFDDHNPCPFEMMVEFCKDVDRWLSDHPDNGVAIHCKAGKGRTGLLISTYLLHSNLYPEIQTATQALQLYAEKRTQNKKGVTIPSQIRWVYYYEAWLGRGGVHRPLSFTYEPKTFSILHARLITIPRFDSSMWGGGCDPYMIVNVMIPDGEKHRENCAFQYYKTVTIYDQKSVTSKIQKCHPSQKYADISIVRENFVGSTIGDLCVRGNVEIVFKHLDDFGKEEKMCSFWFNTAFVNSKQLVFDKMVIDSACKDKRNRMFLSEFKIELYLEPVSDDNFDPAGFVECSARQTSYESSRFLHEIKHSIHEEDAEAISSYSESEEERMNGDKSRFMKNCDEDKSFKKVGFSGV